MNPRLDKIHLRDLSARCIIGINDWERRKKQDVLVNITIFADLRGAGQSDRLEDTVNYKAIKDRVVTMIEGSDFGLLERLAENVAAICLDEQGVHRVDVTVDKPGALRFARSVAVEISRTKS